MSLSVTQTWPEVRAILKSLSVVLHLAAEGGDETLSVVDCCHCDASDVSNTFIKTLFYYIFFGGGGGWYLLNDIPPSSALMTDVPPLSNPLSPKSPRTSPQVLRSHFPRSVYVLGYFLAPCYSPLCLIPVAKPACRHTDPEASFHHVLLVF